jgi:copper oxidase (laccase) domain-containing protein
MIQSNQPTLFGDDVVAGLSSVEEGNMHFAYGDEEETRQNRLRFLEECDIDPTQTTLLQVSYQDNTDFTRYRVVEDENLGEGMLAPVVAPSADAFVVTRPDHAIFLPLADCIGAIIYDPTDKIMMVSHLCRHSIEQEGAYKSIQYLVDEFGSNPRDLKIWLSPSVGSDSYPLTAFEGRSLQEVACAQFEQAGVGLEHIEVSDTDTAEDDNYFSHSAYLAGEQMTDGRFAIVAMMRD